MSKSVIVGMSGGVDSSVAAYLLKEQGYKVLGVTIRMFESGTNDSSSEAKRIADIIGIPHVTLDLSKEFKEKVVDYFVSEYLNCKTPNPCVVCNKNLKWRGLFNKFKDFDASYLATGHYSTIKKSSEGRLSISMPTDLNKDQSYFLYTLSQEELSHTLFPLGKYDKEKVRKIAKNIGDFISKKKDSQDICFIPNGDYKAFLEKNVDLSHVKPGNFVDKNGRVLGSHKGLYNYTIGQRKNLGIALGERMYVQSLNPKTNEVVLGRDEDLFTDTLYASNINFMGNSKVYEDKTYMARIRYAHKGSTCRVYKEGSDKIKVVFNEPQRAITPGQSVVIYEDDLVALGGIIV